MAITHLSRSQMLLGEEAMARLKTKRVAIFGAGGVGGHAIEALARSGIGALDIIDNDTVSLTNLNRQLLATLETIDQYKVDVAKDRILSIDPSICVTTYKCFYLPDQRDQFDISQYDYIIDAIDTISAKLDLIAYAKEKGVPIICAMGCGNRLDPSQLRLGDIFETKNDPLAKVMRHELRKRHIDHVDVVYSLEKPIVPLPSAEKTHRHSLPGSISFVPGVAGMFMASVVVRRLSQE